jgi:hypothetical protein
VYVLGGTLNPKTRIPIASVYVLDLAGHRLQWRRCANMQVPRIQISEFSIDFRVAILGGNIFVFGGAGQTGFSADEVYSPDTDTWTWLKARKQIKPVCEVFSIGKKLIVCGREKDVEYDKDIASNSDNEVLEAPKESIEKQLSTFATHEDRKCQIVVHSGGLPRLIKTCNLDAKDDGDSMYNLIGETVKAKVDILNFWIDNIVGYITREIQCYQAFRLPGNSVRAYDPVTDEWSEVDIRYLDLAGKDISRLSTPYYYRDLSDYSKFKMWSLIL